MELFQKSQAAYRVYADGSCDKKGNGGWAAIIVSENRSIELSGSVMNTSNNRMELTAVLEGLAALPDSASDITVISDSQYVVTGAACVSWWRDHDWMSRRTGKQIRYIEMWQRFLALVSGSRLVRTLWCKGHAGITLNELCDKLAKKERDKLIMTGKCSSSRRTAPGSGIGKDQNVILSGMGMPAAIAGL
ncbi:ribonuclease H [Succinimonas sp.]|uniref:ribonuclease H family protein n=1 Tax=Succinimonas sp. TaxID=1936151 RepID=UPI00386CAAD1